MAKDKKERVQKERPPQALLTKLIFLPLKVSSKLITSGLAAIFISIIIEWIGFTFFWKDNPHHAYEMFMYEYESLESVFKHSIAGFNPIEFIATGVKIGYNLLFNLPMIVSIKSWLATPVEYSSSIGQLIKNIISHSMTYIEASAYIILTVMMRIIIFILSTPWFVLCAFIGFVNGAVEREIRKFEGGIEHGLIYHVAKNNLWVVAITTWMIYLSIPFAVAPYFILIPAGILFGIIIYIVVWSFKKYL